MNGLGIIRAILRYQPYYAVVGHQIYTFIANCRAITQAGNAKVFYVTATHMRYACLEITTYEKNG
jgi:hypothetical protein